jgi:hypothetical protein
MTTRRRLVKSKKAVRPRKLMPHRARALDDSSEEALDDWMAACPAADPVALDQVCLGLFL